VNVDCSKRLRHGSGLPEFGNSRARRWSNDGTPLGFDEREPTFQGSDQSRNPSL
jgi:hypothetical protein